MDDFLRRPDLDSCVIRALQRLGRALDPVVSVDSFSSVAQRLNVRATLFDRLRNILRIDATSPTQVLPGPDATDPSAVLAARAELDLMRTNLDAFRHELQQERPKRGPAQHRREGIDIIEDHLKRHGNSLWGHAIQLSNKAGGGIRLVDRTNNGAENLFQQWKHGERRRCGRKNLAEDLEHLPAAAILTLNLNHDDYVKILCGSLDELPQAFARLDTKRLAETYQTVTSALPPAQEPPELIATASLPKDDRSLVRSEQLQGYIKAAAMSRAPRVVVSLR